MIGETAYERKHGGRRLGVIVGQRTASDAKGRPVEQWEIRSSRGVKFFMDKTDVRLAPQPEPAPEPKPEMPPPPAPVETAEKTKAPIAPQRAARRSAVPAVVALVGIALVVFGIVLLATDLGGKISSSRRYAIGLAPLLLGLLVILIGTGLIDEQSYGPAGPRTALDEKTRSRAPEETS